MIFSKISFRKRDFKYVIGYKDDEKFKLLCIMLPKMSGYENVLMKLIYALYQEGQLIVKNTMKYEIKSKTILKNNLIVNKCSIKNI